MPTRFVVKNGSNALQLPHNPALAPVQRHAANADHAGLDLLRLENGDACCANPEWRANSHLRCSRRIVRRAR
jgi:hypothetical protein